MQFSFSWKDNSFEVMKLEIENSIEIPQICCAGHNYNLFVGALKTSLILIETYTLKIFEEYPLNSIRYDTNKKNRYA